MLNMQATDQTADKQVSSLIEKDEKGIRMNDNKINIMHQVGRSNSVWHC